MKLSLTVGDFVVLSLALQGLILSILLLFSSKKIDSNRWLAIFIFVVSYSCLVTEVVIAGLPNKYPMLIVQIPRLRMLLGPLLYFYTISLLSGDRKLSGKSYFHFLPLLFEMGPQVLFVLYASHLLGFPVIQSFIHLKAMQFYFFGQGVATDIPFCLSIIAYTVVSYRSINNYQFSQEGSLYKAKDIKWLKNILYLIFGLLGIWIVLTIIADLFYGNPTVWGNLIMPLLTIIFAYGLGMAAYIRQSKMSAVDVAEYNKPVKIYFSDAEADQYHRQLVTLMEVRRLYLNPALKLDIIAAELAVPERIISNVLNQHIRKNFNDFVNEYRVLEAKKKLADPTLMHFTIAAIAFDCGFNSLATFQRCFKQFAGITPSQYQNTLKVNLSLQK